MADGILFSGGIGTSVIAFEASKHKRITAITVGFEHGPAKDLDFARKMAGFLGIPHKVYIFSADEMVGAVNGVIAILKVFDPYGSAEQCSRVCGLKACKEDGNNQRHDWRCLG